VTQLLLTVDGPIARLTLNRPAQRNALSASMWSAIPGLISQAAETPGVKILILAGAGGHFAAGADIGEFAETYATPENAAAYGEKVAAAMQAVASCPKPVIAQIEGACVGGGCGLALACDIRIAASNIRMGITPGKLGLAYSLGDTKRLVDAVGFSNARLILYTGRLVHAEEARAMGLVDRVVDVAELASTVTSLALEIAATSQVSVRITKATLALIAAGTVQDTDETRAWYLQAAASPDLAEGRSAFLAKRAPNFPVP
jgi:enoyl-CoA hydratase/carnithine racemase